MASRAHRWKGDDTPLTGLNFYSRSKKGFEFYHGTPKKARAALARPNPIKEICPAQRDAEERLRRILEKLPPAPKVGCVEPPLVGRLKPQEPRRDRVRPKVRARSDSTLMARVAAAQGNICILCQWPLEFIDHRPSFHPLRPSWDHVVPRSLGGGNEGNRLVAHRQCNSDKSNREPTAYELSVLRKVNAALAPSDSGSEPKAEDTEGG